MPNEASERADVIVVGGGAIGVCCAWFLAARGIGVILLERGEICSGCSYGNAGWVFPSHSAPLPAPGAIRQGLRWLLDSTSPLYIKPRLDWELFRWLWRFRAACTEERMRRTFALNRELSLRSLALYEKLAALPELDFSYAQRGILVACATPRGLEEIAREVDLLQSIGGEGRVLDASGLRSVEPALSDELAGGAFLPADAHIRPAEFVTGLARAARANGVEIRTGTEVISLEVEGGRISRVIATRGEFACDALVLAGGSWSRGLATPLGLRLPIQPAKGYSLTYRRPEPFGDTPIMLSEAKVGVTPWADALRFAGTLELAGLDLGINRRRVAAIRSAATRYLPSLGELERIETWRGLRPCTPDDLPLIGPVRAIPNLILAGGHGMSGIAQAPLTGELVAQLIAGETPSMDPQPFSPDRF